MLTIQIINFNLEGMNEQEYSNTCDKLADSFAAIPGLITKFWLADANNNCFGGVYIWENREAMENFTKTDLFNSVATHPNLVNISSKEFDILPGPTKVTRGYDLIESAVQSKAV